MNDGFTILYMWIRTFLFTFVPFFLIGLGLSLRPAAVLAGLRIEDPLHSPKRRWLAFVLVSMGLLGAEGILMYLLDRYKSEFFLFITNLPEYVITDYMVNAVIFMGIALMSLWLMQELGLVDIGHGLRNLKFRYHRIDSRLLNPSWEETYIRNHAGSLSACIASFIYIIRMPLRSSWMYVIWALWCKALLIGVNILLLPEALKVVSLWGVNTMSSGTMYVITDPFVLTYILMGYLRGHMIFHRRASLHRMKAAARILLWLSTVLIMGIGLTGMFVLYMMYAGESL